MRKLSFLLILGLVACGGNGGQSDQVISTSQNPSEGKTDVLSITSVTGDGSAVDHFASALIVTGANFSDGMVIELMSTTEINSLKLSYFLISTTQVKTTLPETTKEGDYELIVSKGTEKATAQVKILKGEKGDTGPQGPAGLDGITIAAQFSCIGSTNDLDLTNDTRTGNETDVVRFSNGSYFVSCHSSFLSSDFLYIDRSSYSSWFAADSSGVSNGIISCVPFYVTASYSISGNTVTYTNQSDNSQTQTLSCSQAYP